MRFVKQGVIEQAKGRSVTRVMRKPRTASFSLPLYHPMTELFMTTDAMVTGYDPTGTLKFSGEVVDYQEDSSEGSEKIVVTASDPSWCLDSRLLGKSATGVTFGTAVAMVDRIAIAKSIIETVSPFGYASGIDTSGMTGTSGKTFIGPLYFRKALEVIGELSTALDGFDWTVEPLVPTASIDPAWSAFPELYQTFLALLNQYPRMFGTWGKMRAEGSFGTVRPDVAFEYGDGLHNVKSYNFQASKRGLMNSGFSLPPGFPDNPTQGIIGGDPNNGTMDLESSRRLGLFEGVVSGDLSVDSYRLKQVQENVRIRKQARRQISFVPVTESDETPVFERDFNLGDVVRLRITTNNVLRFDAMVRVFGQTDTIDDDTGQSTPSLMVVSE